MSSPDVIEEVKSKTPDGLGAHAVLLLAASQKPFTQAAQYVRSNGTVVAIGLPAGAVLSSEVFSTVVRMINIRGSYVGSRIDAEEALGFFERGLIECPFKLAPLEQLPEIFGMMSKHFRSIFMALSGGLLTFRREGANSRTLRRQDARARSLSFCFECLCAGSIRWLFSGLSCISVNGCNERFCFFFFFKKNLPYLLHTFLISVTSLIP